MNIIFVNIIQDQYYYISDEKSEFDLLIKSYVIDLLTYDSMCSIHTIYNIKSSKLECEEMK